MTPLSADDVVAIPSVSVETAAPTETPAAADIESLPAPAPAPAVPPTARRLSPLAAISAANAEARRGPEPSRFIDAAQVYDYAEGALYEIYAAPGYLSTIALEPGEAIVTIAAGDTQRWMVQEALAEEASAPRALLLLKPTRAGIRTNIVLVTNRRTYLLEAIAVEGRDYSAQVRWRYPESASAQHHVEMPVALQDLNFRYRITTMRGRPPRWRPLRVFDDGARTYVEFPLDLAVHEAPPLFLIDDGVPALVNYRVHGNRYVIDRLFDTAELRLGAWRQTIVRIVREHPRSAGDGRTP